MLAYRLKHIDNVELAHEPGKVYQVWEDGEITLTKSGRLLGQRTLHCIVPGLPIAINPALFPHRMGEHGYCYTTEAGCNLVRELVRRYGK